MMAACIPARGRDLIYSKSIFFSVRYWLSYPGVVWENLPRVCIINHLLCQPVPKAHHKSSLHLANVNLRIYTTFMRSQKEICSSQSCGFYRMCLHIDIKTCTSLHSQKVYQPEGFLFVLSRHPPQLQCRQLHRNCRHMCLLCAFVHCMKVKFYTDLRDVQHVH